MELYRGLRPCHVAKLVALHGPLAPAHQPPAHAPRWPLDPREIVVAARWLYAPKKTVDATDPGTLL